MAVRAGPGKGPAHQKARVECGGDAKYFVLTCNLPNHLFSKPTGQGRLGWAKLMSEYVEIHSNTLDTLDVLTYYFDVLLQMYLSSNLYPFATNSWSLSETVQGPSQLHSYCQLGARCSDVAPSRNLKFNGIGLRTPDIVHSCRTVCQKRHGKPEKA